MKIVSNATASQSLESQHLYCLHGFLEIGFPKCASTSLYNLIGQHGDVANPKVKEGQLWTLFSRLDDTLQLDLHMLIYANHFRKATSQIAKNTRAITHDGSAWTVYGRVTNHVCLLPVLLSRVLPKTKLVVVMRNPVHRVWSHFWWDCGNHFHQRRQEFIQHGAVMFHNLTVNVIRQFKDCIKSGLPDITCADRTTLHYRGNQEDYCRHVHIGVSMYYIYLVNWFSVFNRDQIFFLRTEDLITNRLPTITSIWKFLRLRDPLQSEEKRVKKMGYENVNTVAHTAEGPEKKMDMKHIAFDMLPETYELLEELFRPYNQKLAALLHDQKFLWQST